MDLHLRQGDASQVQERNGLHRGSGASMPDEKGRADHRLGPVLRNSFKWAIIGLFFTYFLVFFKQNIQFLQQINVKGRTFSIKIGTHDLLNTSLLHYPIPRPGIPPNHINNLVVFCT